MSLPSGPSPSRRRRSRSPRERDPIRRCSQCRKHPPIADLIRSFGIYDGYLRERIHALKYRGELAVAQSLGELMAWTLYQEQAFGPIDGLVPVPLHPKRERERGHNQAQDLAGVIGRCLGTPVIDAVSRGRETVAQSKLAWSDRMTNVSGAFWVLDPSRVKGRRLVVVDDVYTTGATISAVALALKRSGCAWCGGLCAAASSLAKEWSS